MDGGWMDERTYTSIFRDIANPNGAISERNAEHDANQHIGS